MNQAHYYRKLDKLKKHRQAILKANIKMPDKKDKPDKRFNGSDKRK